jgi:hypothetical protein
MSKDDSSIPMDPMRAWRDWFVKNERDWSASLAKVIKDDAVSKALGQGLKAQLYQQDAMAKSMAGPMASMNLPTREDVTALGERIGRLEDAVARVEALLVQARLQGAAAVSRPPRTRKAPRAPKAEGRHAAK